MFGRLEISADTLAESRSLAQAEGSVTGNIVDAENFRNSLEFGFGQDVLADATIRINDELGLSLEPRDLQALQWFAEKDHWTQKGWTKHHW